MVNKKDDWHRERRIGKAVKAGIKCFCGSEAYRDILEVTMNCETFPRVHRIFCPNCGLQMRGPAGNDDDFIVRQWRDISDLYKHQKEEQDKADRAVGMADLISRAAAISEIDEYLQGLDSCISEPDLKLDGYRNGLQVAIQELKALPAVEDVPVVRCKDCKYGKFCFYADGHGLIQCTNTNYPAANVETWPLELDWYCAGGERRETNETG